MDLILWRHAEAEDGAAGVPDAERRLTARGEKQARLVARWLKTRLPKERRILSSPAQRALMTARALELPFETEPRVGLEADAGDVLAAAGWRPDGDGAALVIGHQPTLGRTASLLLAGNEADWVIRKGALWWFSSRGRHNAEILLRAAISPDLLR